MANELGQPTAQEIAEKFCTEMLCNALLCEGCPVYAIKPAVQQSVQADLLESCDCDRSSLHDCVCPQCHARYIASR